MTVNNKNINNNDNDNRIINNNNNNNNDNNNINNNNNNNNNNNLMFPPPRQIFNREGIRKKKRVRISFTLITYLFAPSFYTQNFLLIHFNNTLQMKRFDLCHSRTFFIAGIVE